MKINRHCGGLTLVEVVIASAFLSVIIFGIVRVFQSHVSLVRKNVFLTRATTLAEEISSVVKSQPFDSIFSYDSSIPHPSKPVCCGSTFNPAAYLIDIDESPMKPVLNGFLAKVKAGGFDGFRIDVTFVRRDSSANVTEYLDGFVPWVFGGGIVVPALPGGIPGGCAALDSSLCFQDLNADQDYWDVVDEKPESPFTGLKLVTVKIIKAGEAVGVKEGNILSKWGLSGQEIGSGQSPLKLKINYPKPNTKAFQVAPHTKSALELRTRRTYVSSMWAPNSGVVRIDDTDEPVHLNRQCDLNGSPIPSEDPRTFSSDERFLRVAGYTDESQSGWLRIYDQLGSSVHPGNTVHEAKLFTPSGNAFDKVNFSGKFEILSTPSYLMRDGSHRLWFRKQDPSYDTVFSPYDIRMFNMDNGVPKFTVYYISQYTWPFGGRTPVVAVAVSDYLQGDGVSASKYSGVSPRITWAAVKPVDPVGVTTQTWPTISGQPNPPINWRMAYSVGGATATFMLRDKDYYPWTLDYDTEYKVIWETGDNVGYKSSTTFSFKIPATCEDDTSEPYLKADTSFVTSVAPLILRPLTPVSDPTPVKKNTPHWLYALKFYDLESGINFKSLKIEICPDGPLAPINLTGQTPGCRTLFHHENEFKKTESTYGGSISYSAKSARAYLRATFSSPGTGVLTGLNFTVGSVWQIRASVENWAGLVTTTPDNEWRFKIVP